VDFYEAVGSTVYHHDLHTDAIHPFWTDELPAGSVNTGGFPNQAVENLWSYPVVDDVFIVNDDGSQTYVESHPAEVTLHVTWQRAPATAFSVSGMTGATLLPPEFGGLEPVAQQPFSGRMAWDTAVGNFKAVVFADDGSVMKRFKISGVRTIASLVGTEQIGAFAE